MVPLALFGLVTLAYGLFIPWLGLYGDDWPYLWVNHVFGPAGYIDFVAWDRPFSAWIYLLSTPVLGETVWAYHLFLALLRWVCAVLVWWLMGLVWPERKSLAVWTAALFTIYPGFRQQPIPLEFMLHFSTLALFLLSLGTMLLAVRRPRRRLVYTLVSVLSAAAMFGLEYFIGLELLRPVFLWIVLAEMGLPPRRRPLQVLLHWLPNLAVLAAFVVWRVFIFEFPTYQPAFLSTLTTSPLQSLYQLALRVIGDLRAVTFGAWRQVFSFPHEPRLLAIYALVLLAGAALTALVLRRVERGAAAPLKENWIPMPLLLGVFALLVAGWPYWLTDLPVSLSFPWDRGTLAFMLGATWLVAGVIEMFQPRFRIWILALLVGLGIGFQMQNAASYRVESQKLRTFFWELSWRVPGLKPGAILLSEQIPLNYYGDNGLTPPLNWTYAPAQDSERQVYNFFDLDERLDTPALPALEKGLTVQRAYRSFSFSGSSSDILIVYYRPDRCLQVLGPHDSLLPDLPRRLGEGLSLSNLDVIETRAAPGAQPPAGLIGPEPEHGWCYYYQRAGLAVQQGDWPAVVELGSQAAAQGLEPLDSGEWIPFIEGNARAGEWEAAAELTARASKNGALKPALCAAWQRIQADAPGAEVTQILDRMKCTVSTNS